MSQHTPGPWEAARSGPWDGFDYIKILAGGREIASVVGPQADDEVKATAAVMAAAPDMLDALRVIADKLGEYGGVSPAVARTIARAAIAKAEGA